MSALHRLWEKVSGMPHQHKNAASVRVAVQQLQRTNQELHDHLKPYVEADDPLVSLLTDVFNQRGGTAGSINGKSKPNT